MCRYIFFEFDLDIGGGWWGVCCEGYDWWCYFRWVGVVG